MIDEIDGLQELYEKCREFEKLTNYRIRQAIEPIIEEMNERARTHPDMPTKTGTLKQSFGMKLKTYGRKNNASIVFGIGGVVLQPFYVQDKEKRPYYYYHLVAFGTQDRKSTIRAKETKKMGLGRSQVHFVSKEVNRGRVKPNPFYENLKEEYTKKLNETINQILDEIESEIP